MHATSLEVKLKPLNCGFERSLLSRLNFWITRITPNCKPMSASFEILSLISRNKPSVAKDLVSLGLRFERKLRINSAAVDEERCFSYRSVFLLRKEI